MTYNYHKHQEPAGAEGYRAYSTGQRGWTRPLQRLIVALLTLVLTFPNYAFSQGVVITPEGAGGNHSCVFPLNQQNGLNTQRAGYCHNADNHVVSCQRTVVGYDTQATVLISCQNDLSLTEESTILGIIDYEECQLADLLGASPERITCGLALTNQVVECQATGDLYLMDVSECQDINDKTNWTPPAGDDSYLTEFCSFKSTSRELPNPLDLGGDISIANTITLYIEMGLCMDPLGTLYHCSRQGYYNPITTSFRCGDTQFSDRHGLVSDFCNQSIANDFNSAGCLIGENASGTPRRYKCFDGQNELNINSLFNCTLANSDFVPMSELESEVVYATGTNADNITTVADDECQITYALIDDYDYDNESFELSEADTAILEFNGTMGGLLLSDEVGEGRRLQYLSLCLGVTAIAFAAIGAFLTFGLAAESDDRVTQGLIVGGGLTGALTVFVSSYGLYINTRDDRRDSEESVGRFRALMRGLAGLDTMIYQTIVAVISQLQADVRVAAGDIENLQAANDQANNAIVALQQQNGAQAALIQQLQDSQAVMSELLENNNIRQVVQETMNSMFSQVEALVESQEPPPVEFTNEARTFLNTVAASVGAEEGAVSRLRDYFEQLGGQE